MADKIVKNQRIKIVICIYGFKGADYESEVRFLNFKVSYSICHSKHLKLGIVELLITDLVSNFQNKDYESK